MPDASTQTCHTLQWEMLEKIRVLRTPAAVLDEVVALRARIRTAVMKKSPSDQRSRDVNEEVERLCDRYYRRSSEELWVLPTPDQQ